MSNEVQLKPSELIVIQQGSSHSGRCRKTCLALRIAQPPPEEFQATTHLCLTTTQLPNLKSTLAISFQEFSTNVKLGI